jgi:hypothetical protein
VAAHSRSRNRNIGSVTGTKNVGGSVSSSSITITFETCGDILGNPNADNAFNTADTSKGYVLLNGNNGRSGALLRDYTNFPILTRGVPTISAAVVSNTGIGQRLTSSSNPASSHVSVPQFIAELRDLPQLAHFIGKTLLTSPTGELASFKFGGKAYLGWKFGMAPLISDIKKMIDFSVSTNKRVQRLERLRDKGGVGGRVSGNSSSGSTQAVLLLDSTSGMPSVTAMVKEQISVETWATCRWKVNTTLPKSNSELTSYARRLVLGLDQSQMTSYLWESLPWTWLFDWFINVGDFIRTRNNSVAVLQSTQMCVMTHTTWSTQTSILTKPGYLNVTPVEAQRDVKDRSLSSLSPLPASMPFLSGEQFAILGALTLSKMKSA